LQGQGFAADHQHGQVRQGAAARRVGREHGGHRGRALQVRDAILCNLLGDRYLLHACTAQP